MNTSAAWMNSYLEPPASAHEQAELLTRVGFPLEHREDITLPDGTIDIRQDIELTSNRGDCLCHLGLAREIAAVSGRKLTTPNAVPKATGPAASSIIKVSNREPELCPLYTARVIRGVKVGPSPKWLVNRLLARGDISRNNIVDASNFVLFELGQPTHLFDLAKLADRHIIIRMAKENEPFHPIGEGAAEVKLGDNDLVIADAKSAVAIAGVKGGALTAVTNATTDILIEAATFAAASVRATSRRLGIASDSSYRFERGVHPGQIEHASNRLCELILQLCGGTLCDGIVQDGRPIPPQRQVSMRTDRCRAILGMSINDQQMLDALSRLGFQPSISNGVIDCQTPYPRNDIEREIDLIEEIGRMLGHDAIQIGKTIQVRVAPPQATELAKRAVNDALVGMGYLETVTHSLISERDAAPFVLPDFRLLRVADERAKAEPVLRPSVLPSLMRVLAFNRHNGVRDVKLFETAATFAVTNEPHAERVDLALLHPTPSIEQGLREVRGAIDRIAEIVLGPNAQVSIEPVSGLPWLADGGSATASVQGRALGTFGVIASEVAAQFDLSEQLLCAEIALPAYFHRYPPDTEAKALPSFPSIERDVSAIVDDRFRWSEVKGVVESLQLEHLETVEFVTTFRGKQIGKGRKSLTLRARFRASDRTLTHEEIDPQMTALISQLQSRVSAEIRT